MVWTSSHFVAEVMLVVDVLKFQTTCNKTLGSPKPADCVTAYWEFRSTGNVKFNLKDGPIIKIKGGKSFQNFCEIITTYYRVLILQEWTWSIRKCAIAIGF